MTLNAAETLEQLRHYQTLPETTHVSLVPPTGVALTKVDTDQDETGDETGFEVEPDVFAALAALPVRVGQRKHVQHPDERAVGAAAAVAALEALV